MSDNLYDPSDRPLEPTEDQPLYSMEASDAVRDEVRMDLAGGEVLRAAIAVALRSGRPADAVTAAELLPGGAERVALLGAAKRALRLARSY